MASGSLTRSLTRHVRSSTGSEGSSGSSQELPSLSAFSSFHDVKIDVEGQLHVLRFCVLKFAPVLPHAAHACLYVGRRSHHLIPLWPENADQHLGYLVRDSSHIERFRVRKQRRLVDHNKTKKQKQMDRNTNKDSKSSDGDGGAASGSGDHGGRSSDEHGTERPRRRRSGDALSLQEVLLARRDELLGGGGSSASLDALDTSPAGGRRRRRRARSRQVSEDLLTMASDAAIMGRGEQDQAAGADGQQAGESTASLGQQQQQENETTAQTVRSGELPPPRLASIFSGGGGSSDRQEEPLDRDRMAEILSAALAISAGEFGFDGQLEEKPERTPGNYLDNDKRPPQ